jgi:hypothetical protein
MRKWLARLSFSFIILAAVFAWEGYKAQGRTGLPPQPARATWCYVAAAVALGAGLAGMRERHRP